MVAAALKHLGKAMKAGRAGAQSTLANPILHSQDISTANLCTCARSKLTPSSNTEEKNLVLRRQSHLTRTLPHRGDDHSPAHKSDREVSPEPGSHSPHSTSSLDRAPKSPGILRPLTQLSYFFFQINISHKRKVVIPI